MNSSESDDAVAWQVVRELVDNHLEPAWEGYDEIREAEWLLHTGKYAAAEPLFQSGIRKLQQARARLDEEGLSLISSLGNSDAAPGRVLGFARLEFDQHIKSAEIGYQIVREEREKGRDEMPAEERYSEILRAKSARMTVFWFWSACVVLLSLGFSGGAYFISPWLVLLPVAVCAVVVFLLFVQMALWIEHLIPLADTEMQEFAKRDGWWS